MTGRNLIPVWIGILVLSGMFLVGQPSWEPPECIDNDEDGYGYPGVYTCQHPEEDCDDSDDTRWNLCENYAVLTWDAPTTNADGTPLVDLAGYRVHYGTSPGNYTEIVDIGMVDPTTYTVRNLTSGNTYYFVVTAYDTSRNESDPSNEKSKAIP